jgi:hypothetical protein
VPLASKGESHSHAKEAGVFSTDSGNTSRAARLAGLLRWGIKMAGPPLLGYMAAGAMKVRLPIVAASLSRQAGGEAAREDLAAELNQELGYFMTVCEDQITVLRGRDARDPLRLSMSLYKLIGVTTHLEAGLAQWLDDLYHTNPHLRAVPAAPRKASGGTPPIPPILPSAPAKQSPAAGQPAPPSQPLVWPVSTIPLLPRYKSRKMVRELRRIFQSLLMATQTIQASIRGAKATNHLELAGAIVQTQVLVEWVRLQQQRLQSRYGVGSK